MLNARSIATLGIGFGASQVARIGLWPTGNVPPPKPKPAVEWLGGGGDYRFLDAGQSRADKQAERERLGVVPAEVKRAVEVVARIEARNPVESLQNEKQAIEALARELEREEIAWRDFYAELLRTELRKLIDEELARRLRALIEEQDEEQAIILMLSEM